MSGNVCEWCNDWAGGGYARDSVTNPQGSENGSARIYRGSNWDDNELNSHVRKRSYYAPTIRYEILGFRLASS